MRKKGSARWFGCLSGMAGELAALVLITVLIAVLTASGKLREEQLRPALTAGALAAGIAGAAVSGIGGNRKKSLLVNVLGVAVLFLACGLLMGGKGERGSAVNLLAAPSAILVPLGMLIALGRNEGTHGKRRAGKRHNR